MGMLFLSVFYWSSKFFDDSTRKNTNSGIYSPSFFLTKDRSKRLSHGFQSVKLRKQLFFRNFPGELNLEELNVVYYAGELLFGL